ncbi:hypothetical protein FISHEDRAFT_36968 [Fistulina hepatica ATCC 64428]|uniref:Six-hairpin glycosidase n=1 Tax=Fistulina hepatica ATCC 64428 TaxID=1128425 RepID=A0A0D7AJS2_9AGAR|nr:hypothetical protein FISHEDRAFT_36968 [Fistulina hepatica ATCC 64428]
MYLRLCLLCLWLLSATLSHASIDRHAIVSRYNPVRNASSTSTPLEVGNGRFALGADVTGLQTFLPYAIMSSWGWKNDSLPAGKTLADVEAYHGQSWYNHGRLVEYDFGGADTEIEQWLISNPNRVNLGRIGLFFRSEEDGSVLNVTEADLTDKRQELDIWTGILTSSFSLNGSTAIVTVTCSQEHDEVAIDVTSDLVAVGRLGLFLDFPWNDGQSKFSAPFVGYYNDTSNHTTVLTVRSDQNAQIVHKLVNSTFYTDIGGDAFEITRDSPQTHRYSVNPVLTTSVHDLDVSFSVVVSYGLKNKRSADLSRYNDVVGSSIAAWEDFWLSSGFVDVYTGSTDSRADELQRRIILSRYHMRVNEAGDTPPQESGLVNDGWYGKFHMEMAWWHLQHWALWNNWDLLSRSIGGVYHHFLASSIWRAQVQQGWPAGARWPKMTDPSGHSAPGEINNLLIWQQVHPLVFAEYEYRAAVAGNSPLLGTPEETLTKWVDVVRETADFMSVFAWWNTSTGVYDLGPPMYVVSEDTSPNVTRNPSFELAYWRLGFELAEQWLIRLGEDVPRLWIDVKEQLAPLPVYNGTYVVYEGIESNFWDDPAYTNDHPALVGLYGWLPPTPGLDISIAKVTAEKVWAKWNISNCWGWDFGMLAMSAARNGETERAVEWLLDPWFNFDDVGMPEGGVRVPTPYFPGSGGLLLAIAMMAGGWTGSANTSAPGFPRTGWNVTAEGITGVL